MQTPTMPDIETRPLALTRVKVSGRSRGTAAARVTPYALDATSTPSAAGNSHTDSVTTAPASTQQRKALIAMVPPIAHRRPCAKRSRNGPISGATIANGSMVRPRKSATWPRASPEGTWKKSVPASEIATAASPAVLNECIWISRDSPDSPAPWASAARRAVRIVARPARPVARAVAPRPRTILAPLPPAGVGPGWGSPQRCSSVDESGGRVMCPSCPVAGEPTRNDPT
jgi:hypothetical protein